MENTSLTYEYYFPMLVSSWEDSEDSEEEVLARWAFIKTIPENSKNILLSEETAKAILSICTELKLSIEDGQEIARIVRDFFFNKITSDSLVIEIRARFDIEDPQIIQFISKSIIDKIIHLSPQSGQFRPTNIVAQSENSTLSDALKNYPEIGEQAITTDRIMIKSFPEPARPSVKNWLADYTFNLGHNAHSSIERGNYLFQGSNTKNLASQDRERLGYILKAYDENTLITIDKEKKQIIFSNTGTTSVEKKDDQISNFQFSISKQVPISNDKISKNIANDSYSINQSALQTNKVSYSSPQKLSYERVKTQPYRITPVFGRQQISDNKDSENRRDERTLGKNVVNLRDN